MKKKFLVLVLLLLLSTGCKKNEFKTAAVNGVEKFIAASATNFKFQVFILENSLGLEHTFGDIYFYCYISMW